MTNRPASAPSPGGAAGPRRGECCSADEDDGLMCPICRDTFTDPVVLLQSGRAYDAHCIRLWFLMGGTRCPLTGVKITSHATAPDPALAERAAAARAAATDDDWWAPAVAAVTLKVEGPGKRPASAGGGSWRRRPWTACLARRGGATRGSDERE